MRPREGGSGSGRPNNMKNVNIRSAPIQQQPRGEGGPPGKFFIQNLQIFVNQICTFWQPKLMSIYIYNLYVCTNLDFLSILYSNLDIWSNSNQVEYSQNFDLQNI